MSLNPLGRFVPVSAGEVLEQVVEHLWLHAELRGSACPGQARSVLLSGLSGPSGLSGLSGWSGSTK